jgi:hypothetical protein
MTGRAIRYNLFLCLEKSHKKRIFTPITHANRLQNYVDFSKDINLLASDFYVKPFQRKK